MEGFYSSRDKTYKISGIVFSDKLKNVRITGTLNPQDMKGDIRIIVPSLEVSELLEKDLKGIIYANAKIEGNILENPNFKIDIVGKDLFYKGFNIPRISFVIEGKNLRDLKIKSIFSKIGKSYLMGRGKVNLVNFYGDINGKIYLGEEIYRGFISYSFKGNLDSWIGEVISQEKRLKGSMVIKSSGDIKGKFNLALFKGNLELNIEGRDFKWGVYGRGENLEDFLRQIEFELKDDLSFRSNIVLNIFDRKSYLSLLGKYEENKIKGNFSLKEEDIQGEFIYNFGNEIKLLNITYNQNTIGDLEIKYGKEDLELIGNILKRKIAGKYSFVGALEIIGEGLEIRGKVKDGLFLDRLFLSLGDIYVVASGYTKDMKNIEGDLQIFYKDKNIGFIQLKGPLDNLPISGEILGNELSGNFFLDKISLSIGDNWSLNLNLRDLSLILKGKIYGISLGIEGNLRDKESFTLNLDASDISFVKSRWKGNLNLEETKITFILLDHKIQDVTYGKIEGKLLEGKIEFLGELGSSNKGYLRLLLDSQGFGKIEGKSFPLKFINFPGEVSLDINLANWDIEKGNLTLSNVALFGKNMELIAEIRKDKEYKIYGDILKLGKETGKITGTISKEGSFNFDIALPDLEALYIFIPKEFIKEENSKISINFQGNIEKKEFLGLLFFSSPLEISYIYDKISQIEFKAREEKGKILFDSIEFKNRNSKIVGFGEIYPNLDLKLKLRNLSLNIPSVFQGYIDGDIRIKNNVKIEGNLYLYNSIISYPQESHGEIEFSNLPKVGLSLNLILKDNVNFFIPNLLNITLKGNLEIEGEVSKPLIRGKIDFDKGNIKVLNRDFSLDYGYIKFVGLSYEENIWEISGSSLVQSYLVNLRAYGFMGQSSIYLSSNPPLSLREIIFLLLGQKDLTLAKEETFSLYSLLEEIPLGFQSFFANIFTEFVLNPLLLEISRILNLESIKVQYTLESFVPTWSKVILEKKLGENIIVRVDYPLSEKSLGGVELEYLFKSGLSIKWIRTFEGVDSLFFTYETKF